MSATEKLAWVVITIEGLIIFVNWAIIRWKDQEIQQARDNFQNAGLMVLHLQQQLRLKGMSDDEITKAAQAAGLLEPPTPASIGKGGNAA